MDAHGVWDVNCYVCGKQLGSNKERCGQDGPKRHSRPPCVWVHCDNTIYFTCQKKAAAARQAQAEKDDAYRQQQIQYAAGTLRAEGHSFTQGRSSSDEDDFESPTSQRKRKQQKVATQKMKKQLNVKHVQEDIYLLEEELYDEANLHRMNGLAGPSQSPFKTGVYDAPAPATPDTAADAVEALPAVATSKGNSTEDGTTVVNKGADDATRTVWKHSSKMCLYGWVIKLNPYSAKRGSTEEAWNEVARKCAESTKNVSKQDGRIDVNGHGLQVFVGNQLKAMKKIAQSESTESGQTGKMSDHERKEFDLLSQIYDKKQSISAAKEIEKNEKELLDNIKAGQLGDAIYAKAVGSEPIKAAYIRELNKKRKSVQLRYEALRDANKKMSEEEAIQTLSENDRAILLQYAKVKKDGHVETTTDADFDDDGRDPRDKKKATVMQSIASIASMGNSVVEAMQKPTELEAAMLQYYRTKTANREQQLDTRLERLGAARTSGMITESEYDTLRSKILAEYF